MLTRMITEEHKQRFQERKIDISIAQQMGVHSQKNAIAFDYMLDGVLHNTKLRRGKGDMPWGQTGKKLIPWNIDALKEEITEDDALIICEGEFDAIACIQAGFKFVISVPNGAPSSGNEEGEGRFKYLYESGDKLHANIDKFKTIVLAVDGDEKGIFLRDALSIRLGEERCLWIEWPEGCKDANDVLMKKSTEELQELIWNAKRLWTDEVCRLSDIPDPEPETSYHVGLVGLEQHLRLPKKGLMTVVGPYESGKSTLMRQIAFNMAAIHGWKFAITCFEETAKWRTVNVFRKLRCGAPVSTLSEQEIREADRWIENNIIFIQKKRRHTMNVPRLLDRIEYAIKVYGIDMFIIDPFNMIDHDWNPHGKNKSDYISDVLKDFHEIANDYRVLMCVVAHPPAGQMRANQAKKKSFYTLADIADSAHFANASDIGLCVWQQNDYTYVNIDKIKNRELCGQPTGVELRFNSRSDEFSVSRTGWDALYSGDE
jgi:twinkle protein